MHCRLCVKLENLSRSTEQGSKSQMFWPHAPREGGLGHCNNQPGSMCKIHRFNWTLSVTLWETSLTCPLFKAQKMIIQQTLPQEDFGLSFLVSHFVSLSPFHTTGSSIRPGRPLEDSSYKDAMAKSICLSWKIKNYDTPSQKTKCLYSRFYEHRNTSCRVRWKVHLKRHFHLTRESPREVNAETGPPDTNWYLKTSAFPTAAVLLCYSCISCLLCCRGFTQKREYKLDSQMLGTRYYRQLSGVRGMPRCQSCTAGPRVPVSCEGFQPTRNPQEIPKYGPF